MKRLGWGLVMLLLPLALFGWANVQHWRAETAQEQARITRQWLAAPSDTLLQALPWAARKQFAGRVDTRGVLQRQLDELDDDRHWLNMRKGMASFSGWLALGALVAGIGAWLRLRVDAWRALRSAQYLHQRMTASWRVLGRWLSAYMGLLAGSLCLVLLYETSAGLSHAAQGGLTVLVVVLPLASVLAVCLRTLWRMRQQWPRMGASEASFLGRELVRQEAAALWQWVEGLAAHLQAPLPDHIVVGIDQGFFVTSVPIVLQPGQSVLSGRTLYLSLPCLNVLSQQEAAAIIGHELGHFRSRDTEQGSEINARFSLMCAQFSAMVDAERAVDWVARPVVWMAGEFLHHFQVAVHHWGRAQELLADRAGAEVHGPKLFVQALLRAIALGRMVDALLLERGGEGLLAALARHLQHVPLHLDEDVLGLTMPHPFDTHPPIAARLDNLDVMLDAALLQAAMRAPSEHDRHWFNQLCGAPATKA
ncbi:M48 family metallopeptidase [Pseudomonas vlassakiae]|uniref:M48 family metallopeptidase n=1 Tax=Pseudomonas vlassakiae TaxID=485888 RepID=A0A923GPN2_9PSED|nr:M48 family metallopeptidase [Pseudomonas vlassakiae]